MLAFGGYMKTMNKFIFVFFLIGLNACTMEGKPVHTEQIFSCFDARDKEKFSFRSIDVKSGTVGVLGADSCIVVTDFLGVNRTLCKSQELYIKCVAR